MCNEQSHLSAHTSKTGAFTLLGIWNISLLLAVSFPAVGAKDSFKYLCSGWLPTFMKAFMNFAFWNAKIEDWNFPAVLVVIRNWINMVSLIQWSTGKPKPWQRNFLLAEKDVREKAFKYSRKGEVASYNLKFFKGKNMPAKVLRNNECPKITGEWCLCIKLVLGVWAPRLFHRLENGSKERFLQGVSIIQ